MPKIPIGDEHCDGKFSPHKLFHKHSPRIGRLNEKNKSKKNKWQTETDDLHAQQTRNTKRTFSELLISNKSFYPMCLILNSKDYEKKKRKSVYLLASDLLGEAATFTHSAGCLLCLMYIFSQCCCSINATKPTIKCHVLSSAMVKFI